MARATGTRRAAEQRGRTHGDRTQQQNPGIYHASPHGDITVTALSDGFLDGNLEVLRNIGQEERGRS